MPYKCCAYGCKNADEMDKNTMLFIFPVEIIKSEWLNAIQREDFTATKYSHLCSAHFESNDFVEASGGLLLKQNDQHEIVEVMADEADSGYAEETTEPSMDSAGSAAEETDESNAVVFKLHEEIDNLNLVLDYLERKNGDIYSRMKMLLTSFQQNEPTQDE